MPTSALQPPRYTLIVVDHNPAFSNSPSPAPLPPSFVPSCGVLIIAQGRELEFLFAHADGQLSLCRSHGYHRLVLVCLNRTHRFPSFKAVQDELRPFIPSVLPAAAVMADVPFLALSADLGERREVDVVDSGANGEVVVEDIHLDGHWIRRLLFVRTGCVQSEARLLSAAAGKAAAVDHAFLGCAYQCGLVTALSLLPHPPSSFLLIGLGAGSLAMFLSAVYPRAAITVVEIDDAVVGFARAYFGFLPTRRMALVVQDGLTFLDSAAASTYDVVIVDCNSADLSQGVSFPPAAFIEPSTLRRIRARTNDPGLFLLNFGCRSASRREEVLTDLADVWEAEGSGRVYELEADDEDINTVLVGWRGGEEDADVSSAVCKSRVLSEAKVEEERTSAEVDGEELRPFRWNASLELRERVDTIHRISRLNDADGSWRIVCTPLPMGAAVEDGGTDLDDGDNASAGVLNAEERRRAKARAKRAKQKLKNKR